MAFFLGIALMVIGGTGLWRYEGRNRFLLIVSMLIFCVGSYYCTSEFNTYGDN